MNIDQLTAERERLLMCMAVHMIVDAEFGEYGSISQALDRIAERVRDLSKGEQYEEGVE